MYLLFICLGKMSPPLHVLLKALSMATSRVRRLSGAWPRGPGCTTGTVAPESITWSPALGLQIAYVILRHLWGIWHYTTSSSTALWLQIGQSRSYSYTAGLKVCRIHMLSAPRLVWARNGDFSDSCKTHHNTIIKHLQNRCKEETTWSKGELKACGSQASCFARLCPRALTCLLCFEVSRADWAMPRI